MKFKPVQDRIVTKPAKAETVTAGGIVLSDKAAEKPSEAVVLAVGAGKKIKSTGVVIPSELAVGDRVLYYAGAGQHIKIDGEEVLILKEEEIYAVIEGDSELE